MESPRSQHHGLNDPDERRAAGLMLGALWLAGGVSGALWYLVPGAEMAHWQLGLANAVASTVLGVVCLLAPWRALSPGWLYPPMWLALPVITWVMAINGGFESPTVHYVFLTSVLGGYYLSLRHALAYLACGMLVPATPLLYDERALAGTAIAEIALTAPIYAAVGLAIVLAKRQLVVLRDESRDQARRDPLTGLCNRRALTEALQRSRGASLALLMVDLDDFKSVNTRYGHATGDQVLRVAARALTGVTRAGDVVARLGGDEFAVLVPDAREHDLAPLSQRIVEAMHAADQELALDGFRLTASVGFARRQGIADAEIDHLLAEADRGMRAAKESGKDRWMLAMPSAAGL